MAGPIVVAWLHYIGILVLVASLLGEHVVLKAQLTAAQAKTIQRLDIFYGASAGLVVVTGIARMFLEKGVDYYLHRPPFHVLVGLFIVVGLISIYPTMVFLRWRGDTRAGRGQELEAGQLKRLQIILRVELTLMLLAPLFATWMAHAS